MKWDEPTELIFDETNVPLIVCSFTGRMYPKSEMVFRNGHWVHNAFADTPTKDIEPKEEI